MVARRRIRVRSRALAYSLAALAEAGERLPSVRVGAYRVSLQPASGLLYVKRRDAYLGCILSTDIWRTRGATKIDIASIKLLVEKFPSVAAGAAMLDLTDPRCAVCGRPIGTTPLYAEDRARGIGHSCWEAGQFATFERRAIAGDRKRGKMKSLSSTTKTRRRRNGK